MSPEYLKSLVSPLTETILEAGETVMDVFHSDFSVYDKNDESPVTEADRRGEIIIEKALSAIAPSIPMVGEEAKSEGKCPDISGGTFWLVDPLDGTKEFIKKGNDFTVNIGLIKDGTPIMGFVLVPASNELFWGIVNEGAWKADIVGGKVTNTRAIKCRKTNPDAMTIVASKSHRSTELEDYLADYQGAENVSIGSSLKLLLLAEGKADLYPRLGPTCEWDTAAAHAVLLAAGGRVTVPGGEDLTYAKDLKTFLNPWFLCVADQSFDAKPL
ncbi:3'(2'),5'-bisphosphate nucleotidase CysQ [Temperatibacter marinus]|uniref:3'(2'),5'-bisphosphate nucleotidase CysQ n=1 Tax=Temperatibacter marinus TaxID=1456591 RepID=A0AA52EFH9_9PROT|nr:3'(2'),5'-bisphosphate nucleotidase CysQ [Temperatibacter marinus]WND01885.1 3'(2'),5'-bisphosphate nucleotidase CysQ [Temperatibacter marinus]